MCVCVCELDGVEMRSTKKRGSMRIVWGWQSLVERNGTSGRAARKEETDVMR